MDRSTDSRRLPHPWYRGCKTEEEKAQRELLVRNSTAFATLLLGMLEDRYNAIDRKGFREEDYGDSNWVFLQAFRNGKLAELTEISDLFNYLQK